jgi:hypothetical protein
VSALVRNIDSENTLDSFTIPTRPDGTYFRYEMICDDGWTRFYADTAAELLNHLIDGYSDLDDQARLAARILHAVDMQVVLQASLTTFYEDENRTAAEQQILMQPRHIQPAVAVWDCTIPLVVIDAYYAPFTSTPRPISGTSDYTESENVWWLTPTEGEDAYLSSLHEASIITLNIAKDEAI